MTLQLDQICACHKSIQKSHSNGSITATLSIIPLATKSDIATSPTLSRPRKVALQPPCNFTKSALAAKDHIAASSNSAPATKNYTPTSLQLRQVGLPTMNNDIRVWSALNMKRPGQCAEHQESPCNMCTCSELCKFKI